MKKKYRVTALMSGSSMDGVDLACCDLWWNGLVWDYTILEAFTLPYPVELYRKLDGACNMEPGDIQKLDIELGHFYGELLNGFHARIKLYPDLISSHGHTILHEPAKGVTLQAGNGSIIAEKTNITVINDFRKEDVAQGGQGAPLVPIGDRLLFSGYDGCLNLGGIANISYDNSDGNRIAYDLCPANMALNNVAAREGLDYDLNGEIARSGSVHHQLLQQLNGLQYYSYEAPKSLGREWFLEQFLPLMQKSGLPSSDLMSTVVEHIAQQIARGINSAGIGKVLVTGGGAMNRTLVDRLKHYSVASLVTPGKQLINFKEALIFALLGVLKIRGEINCLASVTGGREDISAGTIHPV
jgi:anhydro-N-acetylmuramic acid kinase